ncbi:MAG: rhodanese-like domain-containing protein [Spirochaetes bacterium]|nr:rhodanese-like domain-containing protein [Spirochaetota bacterium]
MTADELVAEAKKSIESVSVNEAKNNLGKKGVVFLDVREPKEYKAGHLPGAINIPRGLLEFFVTKDISDKNTKIFVYCKTGGRSALAAATLVKMGYKNVINVDGGWVAWEKAGYPVE